MQVRKFIQFHIIKHDDETKPKQLFALANDGTVWASHATRNNWLYVGSAPQVEYPVFSEFYKGELK